MSIASHTTSAQRLGWYAAIATSILAVLTLGMAIFTPPLSGPYCVSDCYSYPYTDIAARFPRDYYWMYPAMVLSVVFYVMMACVHHVAREDRQVYSRIGLSFALIATAVLVIDYFVQVSVIQPSLVQGENDGIAILSQFNPHGVFIVLEEIGFIMMSLAMLCMAPAIDGTTKVDRWIRWVLIASFGFTLMALVGYSVVYGLEREYRFEVVTISANWLALITGGALLAVKFRRGLRPA